MSFGTLTLWIWLGGAVAAGLILLLFNLRFAVTLRGERKLLKGAECDLPVYVLEGLSSPCLFGVFRPAVYLSPEAAGEPRMLRHILFHEETHYRHGDHIWSLLRCAALAIHWWNPLVWLAVSMSRRDGELFCDEGALKKLGDGERRAYGNTLLTLVTAGPSVSMLMSCATTMSGGKKALRERISRIAIPVKRHAWAVILVLTVAMIAAACAFIDPVEKPSDGPTDDPTDDPTDATDLTDATEEPSDLTDDPTDATQDPTEPEEPTDTPDPEEKPYRVPDLYPAAEPYNVLSVRDLEPYAPPKVTNTGSFNGTTVVDSVTVGGNVTVLLENDRGQRAVALKDGEGQRVFMTGLSQNAKITAFHDVLGFDGVRVQNGGVYDYFRFTDAGDPVLVLESNPSLLSGKPQARDIDGDGIREIVDGRIIFIFRDGGIYFAKIDQLLNDIEDDNKDVGALIYDGGMVLHCYATPKGADRSRYYTRYVSFDGENFSVYKENKPWHDHVVDGAGEGIPSEVMEAARDYVEKEAIVQNPDGTYSRWSSYSQSAVGEALHDDWRIERMRLDWQQPRDGGWTLEVYYFNYELHTITPEKVELAGGMYFTEDDWVCPTYPGCEVLFFKNEGGVRTFLWHAMINDMRPGSEYFQEYLEVCLAEMGLNPTYPLNPSGNEPLDPALVDVLGEYLDIRNKMLSDERENMEEYMSAMSALCEGDRMAERVQFWSHAADNYEKARNSDGFRLLDTDLEWEGFYNSDKDQPIIEIRLWIDYYFYTTQSGNNWVNKDHIGYDWKGDIVVVKRLEDGRYVIIDDQGKYDILFGPNAQAFSGGSVRMSWDEYLNRR